MILSLIEQVRDQLQERDRLERLQTEIKEVRATQEMLEETLKQARALRFLCTLLRARLAEERPFVAARLASLHQETAESHAAYQTERRQVSSLRGIGTRLRDLEEHLDKRWQIHADHTVKPQADLFHLVRSLPEIQAQADEITRLLARLQRQSEKAPRSASDLESFDQGLATLTSYLSQLEGLSDEVKTFLERVAAGQATLADLSEEVRAWCQRGERAQTFRISFTRQAGQS